MKHLKSVFACFEEKARSAKVKAAVMAAAITSAMTPVAMASDMSGGTLSGTVSDMNTLMGGFEYVVMLLNEVWGLLLSNPLLCLFLAAGLVSVGVRAFRKLKSAAKAQSPKRGVGSPTFRLLLRRLFMRAFKIKSVFLFCLVLGVLTVPAHASYWGTEPICPNCGIVMTFDSFFSGSCTSGGTALFACPNCRAKEYGTVSATGHNFRETSRTAPTCTTSGTSYQK